MQQKTSRTHGWVHEWGYIRMKLTGRQCGALVRETIVIRQEIVRESTLGTLPTQLGVTQYCISTCPSFYVQKAASCLHHRLLQSCPYKFLKQGNWKGMLSTALKHSIGPFLTSAASSQISTLTLHTTMRLPPAIIGAESQLKILHNTGRTAQATIQIINVDHFSTQSPEKTWHLKLTASAPSHLRYEGEGDHPS
jgi:hypothetical protein